MPRYEQIGITYYDTGDEGPRWVVTFDTLTTTLDEFGLNPVIEPDLRETAATYVYAEYDLALQYASEQCQLYGYPVVLKDEQGTESTVYTVTSPLMPGESPGSP